jgi:2'-deoxynucleoside 5'-phosphate N-hydrolase
VTGSPKKAYLAIKYHPDFRNRPLIEAFDAALQDNQWEMVAVCRDVEKWGGVTLTLQELMRVSFDLIDQCDCLLVVLNEKGVGIGIECGYAYAHQKPIFVMAEQGSNISETLQGIARWVLFYSSTAELSDKLKALSISDPALNT